MSGKLHKNKLSATNFAFHENFEPHHDIGLTNHQVTKSQNHPILAATLFFLPCLYNRSGDFGLNQEILNIHAALIERCRAGDQTAHHKLYKLYAKAMYNVGYRITRSEEEAQDVLQEAFISAFRNLERYRGDSTFGAWLKRIVVNKAINSVQKRKLEPIPDHDAWDVAEEEVVAEYKEELTVDRVRRGIDQLPDGYRTVLSLYLLEGYDHQEIAEIMGFTESTSKSQLNRAKSRLKEILTEKKVSEK
jgi:RNA polymerase sigma-70 factor (ECF subfamily)